MSRRRQHPDREAQEVETLLAWSRWKDVPEWFLEHPDPDVRQLAAITQATVAACNASIGKALADGEAGRPVDYDAERSERMAEYRRYAALAEARKAFAEPRSLQWRHPYPHIQRMPTPAPFHPNRRRTDE